MEYWDKNGNIHNDEAQKIDIIERAYNKLLAGLSNSADWINNENPESEDYKQKLNSILAVESLVLPSAKVVEYFPYRNDIWAGRKLIYDRIFNQPQEKIKNDGREFYQNFLQKNPAYIRDYGVVPFGQKNKGKDRTLNFLEYPFLRKKMYDSEKMKTTNYKNESDRVYDYFKNVDSGDVYNYVIENIKNVGKRYKMMQNKTKGE